MKQPENVYQKIDGARWRHIWLVGDIHGCFSLLMAKLRACRFDPGRILLVSVGDVIDRGPDSLRCLQLLRRRWVVAVRGNHEQMAMDALASAQTSLWFLNGGDWLPALPVLQQTQAKNALENCQQLPRYLRLSVSRAGILWRMRIIPTMCISGKRTSIFSRCCGVAADSANSIREKDHRRRSLLVWSYAAAPSRGHRQSALHRYGRCVWRGSDAGSITIARSRCTAVRVARIHRQNLLSDNNRPGEYAVRPYKTGIVAPYRKYRPRYPHNRRPGNTQKEPVRTFHPQFVQP